LGEVYKGEHDGTTLIEREEAAIFQFHGECERQYKLEKNKWNILKEKNVKYSTSCAKEICLGGDGAK